MEFLISLYDNALIYYPNVFFLVVFFLSILGVITIGIGIIVVWKKIKRVIQEVKSNLKQIKKIGRGERKRMSLAPMVRIFFEKKKILLAYIIRFLATSFAYTIRVFFVRINTVLGYIESKTKKIVKKIEEEIFIKE